MSKSKKWIWGYACIIVLIVLGICGVLLTRLPVSETVIESHGTSADGLETLRNQRGVASAPPRAPKAGYKWVWHGDHWHEMSLAQSDAPPVADNTVSVQFTPPKTDGTSLQARAAASDEVPRYADLKRMTQAELSKLFREYHAKADALYDEKERRWEAWFQAESGSDTAKSLKNAFYSIMWEFSVYRATAGKAHDVLMWRVGLERSKHPERQISWVLPEPFDE